MPSINQMASLVTQLQSPYITVHQDRCQLVRNRNADCLRCASVCTSGCISFDGEELRIRPEKCIGCGTCATICPTCCLEAHHPNDAELLARCRAAAAANDGVAVIGCATLLGRAEGLFDPDKVVRVECLGRVEESLLTTLAAEGVVQVALAHGACDSCEHRTGRAMAEDVLATERELLRTWGAPMQVRLGVKMPASVRAAERGFDQGKREALTRGGREAARIGATTADFALREALGAEQPDLHPEARRSYTKVMADGTLPHFLPDRRERLLDALAALGEPDDVMISTRLWGHVIIDPVVCQSCLMCATFCPTGALRRYEAEDGTFGVEHYPGDCVKCRCCQNICPAGAIEISEEVFAVDMLAGMTDRYPMRKPAVKRGTAHTIVNIQRTLMSVAEVYER